MESRQRMRRGGRSSSVVLVCVLAFFLACTCSVWGLARVLVPTLQRPAGMALDAASNTLYFVDTKARQLLSIQVPKTSPGGPDTSIPVDVRANLPSLCVGGPVDVKLDLLTGSAFVICDKSGNLFRVNLSSGDCYWVASVPGDLSSLALDLRGDQSYAYVVGVKPDLRGALWRIVVTAGECVQVGETLSEPTALAISASGTAYVAEREVFLCGPTIDGPLFCAQSFLRTYDLDTGHLVASSGLGEYRSGLTDETYIATSLTWFNASETGLIVTAVQSYRLGGTGKYISSGSVSFLDVGTKEMQCIQSFTGGLLGGTLAPGSFVAYVSNGRAIRDTLLFDPADQTGRVFKCVGLIPATKIDAATGLATSEGLVKVQKAALGGTLDIYGPLHEWSKNPDFSRYRFQISSDGGRSYVPLLGVSWQMYHYNGIGEDTLETITPDPEGGYSLRWGGGVYQPYDWTPSYLMLRWPSWLGTYTVRLKVELWDGSGWVPAPHQVYERDTLVLTIDNVPPQAELSVFQRESILGDCSCSSETDPLKLGECAVLTTGLPAFCFKVVASDDTGPTPANPNGHLASWTLDALWGNDHVDHIAHDERFAHSGAWFGATEDAPLSACWEAKCDCAYTFSLVVSKNVTNGYPNFSNYTWRHMSFTILNAGDCPK